MRLLRSTAAACLVLAFSLPAFAAEGVAIDSVFLDNAPDLSLLLPVSAAVVAAFFAFSFIFATVAIDAVFTLHSFTVCSDASCLVIVVIFFFYPVCVIVVDSRWLHLNLLFYIPILRLNCFANAEVARNALSVA